MARFNIKRNNLRKFGKGRAKGKRRLGPADVGPPKGLRGRARELWLRLVPGQVNGPGRLELLRLALEVLQEHDLASQVIWREGATVTSRRSGLTRPHPLLRLCEKNRRLFLRYARLLHLQWDTLWNLEAWRPGSEGGEVL